MTREVVVVAGVRTAVGDFGGSLKDFSPTQLGAMVVKEVVARAGVSADQVGHVVFGHVVNSEPRDMYLSRVAAIEGGLDKSHASAHAEPPVWFWPASHCDCGSKHYVG
jgi:acetyl-CoA C-acetyltransferase